MSAAINLLDSSKQPFAGVSLTAAQAERLLSICVSLIDLCTEVTGKIDPAAGNLVAYACEDVLSGILLGQNLSRRSPHLVTIESAMPERRKVPPHLCYLP